MSHRRELIAMGSRTQISEVNNRFRPRIVVDTVSAARDIVIASDGLAVALPGLIEREFKDGICALLPIELPLMRLNYGFVWKRVRTHSPAGNAFIEFVWNIEKSIAD
jgi:DNA-binding transcriptional LysR family regulator